MSIYKEGEIEEEAALIVAKLMAASARTAPKTRGVDLIKTAIITGEEKERVAKAMEQKLKTKANPIQSFKRDADNVRNSSTILLLGTSRDPKKPEDPLNCGACGYGTCAEFIGAGEKRGEDYTGPVCLFEGVDLGIALGSAVKIASELNIDNRIMYTIGAAAKELDLLDSDIIMGIPLSVTGKNIYFDRKV